MSRTSQPAHAVGVCQLVGSATRSNIASISRWSTLSRRRLLAGCWKFHVGSPVMDPLLLRPWVRLPARSHDDIGVAAVALVGDGEQLPGTGDTLERVLATVVESDPRSGDQVGHR